jgi:hypothetical protein
MNKQETFNFDDWVEKFFEYTKADYESDLKFIEVFEKKGVNKPLLDFLKWKTSLYEPKMINNCMKMVLK